MKKISLLPLLLFCTYINAQSKKSYWSAGLNPLGVIEVIPAIGPCFSYRISPRFEVWSEASYLFGGPNRIYDWQHLKGYRFILQPRFYTKRGSMFFIAPEFRLKHYSYKATGSFINSTIGDTLNSFPYQGSQVLIGGAFVVGGQIVLSRRHHLYLEITGGIGSKVRHIKRAKVPADYHYYYYRRNAFSTGYNDDGRIDPYVPLGFRLIWKLNR